MEGGREQVFSFNCRFKKLAFFWMKNKNNQRLAACFADELEIMVNLNMQITIRVYLDNFSLEFFVMLEMI